MQTVAENDVGRKERGRQRVQQSVLKIFTWKVDVVRQRARTAFFIRRKSSSHCRFHSSVLLLVALTVLLTKSFISAFHTLPKCLEWIFFSPENMEGKFQENISFLFLLPAHTFHLFFSFYSVFNFVSLQSFHKPPRGSA